MQVRLATREDAATIARIYNQGIEDRLATFETTPRTPADVERWLDGPHPTVVVTDPDVIAFARASEYRPRECYRGVFEFAVYVDRDRRGCGAGTAAMRELFARSVAAGGWKL